MVQSWHRALGVYGLYVKNHKLLVIKKSGGPYKNRYDLPGGSLEEGESLSEAMDREFTEETGLKVLRKNQIGIVDFQLPWHWKTYTHVHHMAVFYLVEMANGALVDPEQFDGQDSIGTHWITEEEVNIDHVSPLVMEAFSWLTSKRISTGPVRYKSWHVIEKQEEAPWNA